MDNDSEHAELYHVITPHSCRHCARIVVKHRNVTKWDDFTVRLPHTKSEAIQAAIEGCPLFWIFDDVFQKASLNSSIRTAFKSLSTRDTSHLDENFPDTVTHTMGEPGGTLKYFRRVKYLLGHLRRRCLYLTFNWRMYKSSYDLSIYYLTERGVFAKCVKALLGKQVYNEDLERH